MHFPSYRMQQTAHDAACISSLQHLGKGGICHGKPHKPAHPKASTPSMYTTNYGLHPQL